ncbi:hypothetical protein [Beggiatoa leptomitoformis]|uniref:Uncharacterized protein n=1 Tax=Beggiatoa leptomitoformis TaxID=288004 RepID=A0A2N9YDG8_9GAMM|nr:hypothetical protein [Beggiatoa leptomitoformis]ALG69061.1 hypothetical protein AL038_16935 [Beggiatoa leptomitoformis]AUI68530.1 hypothetical protein BLE401_07305 [Beggiatoa leptomitoformis]
MGITLTDAHGTTAQQRFKKRRVKTEKALQKIRQRPSSLSLFVKYFFIPLILLMFWLFLKVDIRLNDTHEVGQRLYTLAAFLSQ